MNREETVRLHRYVCGACPQQASDEFTPNIWHDLLGDLVLTDCLEAVKTVTARQPFVAPAEIRAEVRRIRTGRLEGFIYVPVEGDDDPDVYLANLRAQRAAVASGRREAAPAELSPSPPRAEAVRALVAGAFRGRP